MNFFKSSFFGDLKLPDILSSQPADTTSRWEQQWDVDDGADPSADLLLPHGPHAPEIGPSQAADVAPTEPLATAAAAGGEGAVERSGAWSFGNLVKSLTSKSEEMLQAYRRDLEEFSSGLKKETEVIAGVAAHAVKELPGSLDVGASVAQESLETVGQAIEDFGSSVWRGTVDILGQGKEAIMEDEEDSADATAGISRYVPTPVTTGRYSRFEAQVLSMQHDSSTYCDEPDDEGDYGQWRITFNLEERSEEMESILGNNAFMQELLSKVVPSVVDRETFWTRYFYRIYKFRQAEEARADLVKRATNSEEEDLRWDVDEESEDDTALASEKGNEQVQQENEEIEDLKGNVEDQKVGDKDDIGDEKTCDSVGLPNVRTGPGIDNEQANATNSPVVEEEDDSSWEVAEDMEDSSSNESKKSNNSEASWEVPEVATADTRRKGLAIEEEVTGATKADVMRKIVSIEEEDLSWDVEDEDDSFKP